MTPKKIFHRIGQWCCPRLNEGDMFVERWVGREVRTHVPFRTQRYPRILFICLIVISAALMVWTIALLPTTQIQLTHYIEEHYPGVVLEDEETEEKAQ